MNNIKLIRFKDYAKGKRVAVIGIGISNRPLIKWLNAIGMDIVACDKLSEDDVKNVEHDIQKMLDDYIGNIDAALAQKEKDIMQV